MNTENSQDSIPEPTPASKSKKPVRKKSTAKKIKRLKTICPYCNRRFPNKSSLKPHLRYCADAKSHFVFEKAYKHAIKTSLLTRNGTNLKQHKQILCDECPKRFKIKSHFIDHLTNEHSKAPNSVTCDSCPVRCPDKTVLIEHIKNVHNRQTFQCPNCNATFARQHHVFRHIAQTGCDGGDATKFPCEICDAVFSRKDNLMVHLRLQHIQQKYYACKVCSKFNTKNFNKLVAHWSQVHNSNLECDHCGKTCSSRAAIVKHLEIHGEKKFVCDVCNYRTFTVEVMRRHILTHVEKKPFQCHMCPKSYIQSSQLRNHMIRHFGHKCDQCDEQFNNKYDLSLHLRKHTGQTKLVCIYKNCAFATKPFEDEKSLKMHLKSHDARVYKCDVCNKSYNTAVNLRNHMAVHTLERPRRCMYCVSARAYIRGEQLLKHVRKNHSSVFLQHLRHVRNVLGITNQTKRVRKLELESILNVIDAESDRIVKGCGEGVLYGGMVMETDTEAVKEIEIEIPPKIKVESTLMSEDELSASLRKLLSQLIDKETLECFGWPYELVDTVLEKVIEHCGAKPADRTRWTRVQTLRENAKYLFLHAIEDKVVTKMLTTHTIDQIVKHMLNNVSDDVLQGENEM